MGLLNKKKEAETAVDEISLADLESEKASEPELPFKSNQSKYKIIQAIKELFVWYPKNYDPEERKLLFKLDAYILTYACLGFFIKTLDAANVKYAYVSGMKEDLNLYGNELNWLNWIYQIGYVAGQLPALLIMSRPKYSKYVFPVLEIIYGILTFAQSRVSKIHQLYVIRFLVGFAEAPAYSGTHWVLGKWYGGVSYRGNGAELFKRAGTWYASSNLANFTTGHLQAAAYKNLAGKHGMAGWQWLFIIDGIFTIPIALLGFVVWPGIPESGKPWYLSKSEYGLVHKRLERYGIEKAKKIDLQIFKDTFSKWPWYLFCFNYTIMCICWYPIGYFALWLKAQGTFSVEHINQYPTGVDAVGLFACFTGTILASVYPPWIIYTIGASGPFVCSIILSIYDVPTAAIFFAFYYAALINTTTTILYSYVNIVLREHSEIKAITVASMMIFAQAIPVSLSFAIFPTVNKKHPTWQAPQWRIGWRITAVLAAVMSVSFGLIILIHRRDKKLGIAYNNPLAIESSEDTETEISSNDDLGSSVEAEPNEADTQGKNAGKVSIREVTSSRI